MLTFPNIDPVILQVGPLAISWYSMAYVVGILIGWWYVNKIILLAPIGITKKHTEDFVAWAIIGIIIGGRLGYVIFYDPAKYLHNPIDIFKTYEGGMAFHGGVFGYSIAALLFAKKYKIRFLSLMDVSAVAVPIGLFLGRIANFINGELYGRKTDIPWAVIFPGSEGAPRHPSQLYEAFLEGFVLFFIMQYFVYRRRFLAKPGYLSAMLLIFYGVFRAIIEFFREPDVQVGYIAGWFTLGQLLCTPMILLGCYLLVRPTIVKNGQL
jgi:phosphatidylglycerol:prolipoprotein diacylglycerol transferase